MGLGKKIKAFLQFSNVDILEAGQAFDILAAKIKGNEEQKRLIKVKFLGGFNEGWERIKSSVTQKYGVRYWSDKPIPGPLYEKLRMDVQKNLSDLASEWEH